MRQETVTRNIYQYDELSDDARERARNWYRDGLAADYPWASENRESLEAFCDRFPIKAEDWEYDAWSSSITPSFYGDDTLRELSGYKLANYLTSALCRVWFTEPKRYTKNGKTRRSKILRQDTCCPFTGYYMDEVLLQPLRDFIKKPDSRTYEELLGDCLDEWVKACQTDCAWLNSDENVEDSIRANEYEFLENGEPA